MSTDHIPPGTTVQGGTDRPRPVPGDAPEPGALPYRRVRTIFLVLTATRWLPVGLIVGIVTLWPLEQGLSIAQAFTASSLTGLVVFCLELPTAGFADTLGRRPVLLLAAGVNVAAAVALLLANGFVMFCVAAALIGLYRALDSGPLEAWFVDSAQASEPDADLSEPITAALSVQGTVMGLTMAAGSVLSGALIWWHPLQADSWPWPGWSSFLTDNALALPVALSALSTVVHLVASLTILREPHPVTEDAPDRPASTTTRLGSTLAGTGAAMAAGLRLVRGSRVLACLLAVELFWGVAMVVFEKFQSVRLAELVGGTERAGALMGPIAAAGWGVFAGGAALTGLMAGRWGTARAAIVARVLNGAGALVMGLVAGPVALIAAYLVTYGLHGAANPAHSSLLHRQASKKNRATVLSINSMLMFAAFSLTAPLLGLVAERMSTGTAMVVAGAVSILGALCYLPALAQEKNRRAAVVVPESTGTTTC